MKCVEKSKRDAFGPKVSILFLVPNFAASGTSAVKVQTETCGGREREREREHCVVLKNKVCNSSLGIFFFAEVLAGMLVADSLCVTGITPC
jgi:hypothetical protein